MKDTDELTGSTQLAKPRLGKTISKCEERKGMEGNLWIIGDFFHVIIF